MVPSGALLGPLTIFLASVCIMVIELVAGRLMSRFIGQSLYTWTAVIGVILAGITLGNLLGGRLADRARAATLFAVIFLSAAGSAMLVPFLNSACGHALWILACETRLRIFLHVTFTFLLPAVTLGTVGPIAAKMVVESSRATGRALGGVYAWGAAGSIAGTFLTGYYLIAAIGTAATLVLTAALLGVLGLLFAFLAWGSGRAKLIILLVGGPLLLTGVSALAMPGLWMANLAAADGTPVKTLFAKESPYARVAVSARQDLQRIRRLYLDRLPHSEIDAGCATNLLSGYTWLMQGVLEARHGATSPVSLLVIGGGGYALPRQVMATRPGSRVMVAEIDPLVTEAAVAACGLECADALDIRHADGRQVMQALLREDPPAARFDAVIGDTVEYYSLPYHLATRECAQEAARLLKPEGQYLLHIVTDRRNGQAYLAAVLTTLQQVFPRVAVFALKPNPGLHSSYLFVGSASDTGWDRVEVCIRSAHPAYSGGRLPLGDLARGAVVLTDDYAPLEQLVEPVVRADRRDAVQRLLDEARERLQAGSPDEAERLVEKTLQADALSAEAHYTLAVVRRARHDQAGALSELERVLAIDREIFPAQVLKGTLLAEQGKVAEARREWEDVLALRPLNLEVQRNLAYASEYDGKRADAWSRWEGILAVSPEDPTAHFALARLCQAQGRTGEAEAHRTLLRRVDPALKRIQIDPMPIRSIAQALGNIAL